MQPALYEAFGLTVVEAMTSGLPTFATLHGGPAEIIKNTQSGFHIDPHHGDKAADLMADFFERCKVSSELFPAPDYTTSSTGIIKKSKQRTA